MSRRGRLDRQKRIQAQCCRPRGWTPGGEFQHHLNPTLGGQRGESRRHSHSLLTAASPYCTPTSSFRGPCGPCCNHVVVATPIDAAGFRTTCTARTTGALRTTSPYYHMIALVLSQSMSWPIHRL